MTISAKDYRNILEIIDTIYSVPDRSAMFRAVCEKLQKFIGIYSAIFVPTEPKTGEYYFNGYEVFNNSEGAMVLYLDHYVTLDPFITCEWYKNANRVARNTDLVLERSLIRSEFACDFLLPLASVFYVLAVSLASQGDMVGTAGFHRQKQEGDFSDRDKEIINILLPHMARAIRSLDLIHGSELTKEPNGVITTGEDGRPIYMNEAAKLALKGMPLERIPEPGIGSAPAFFKSRSGTYRVRTVPLGRDRRGRLILLERYPAEHRLHPKLDDFKLSRREREIGVLVIQGHSNREIAEQLFISEQTVKDHLHVIFEKTGIRRRGELAAKVLGLRSGIIPL
ncbi:MAG: putative GAF sensor [Geobacteraceae bacterium]|nr:MAG: putative GAF sensor [Geobacteraceae bacterium]